MAQSSIAGYPRIGRDRELKRACEQYWKGKLGLAELRRAGTELRRAHWEAQRRAGIALIPANDFSFYDQVLDAVALIGAVPDRYHWDGQTVDQDTYFAMARGAQRAGLDVTAMEMTKWFDANYHYIVPEWVAGQRFRLASSKPFDELAEAQALGIAARPVLIGPFSLALLGKAHGEGVDVLGATLDGIVAVYGEVIERLAAQGAEWIQLDEPCLVQDRTPEELAALTRAYAALAARRGNAKLWVSTYFGQVGESYAALTALPVQAVGLDMVRGADNLGLIQEQGFPEDKILAAGIVDGRNVWRCDLEEALRGLELLRQTVPTERLIVSSSCSLQFVPYDAGREAGLDEELRGWLAFAEQKMGELSTLTRGLNEGREAIAPELADSAAARQDRKRSPRVHDAAVRDRLAVGDQTARAPFAERQPMQRARLGLPALPTTTIGSFPQTAEVRKMRARFESGDLDEPAYDKFLEDSIAETIALQERLGLDMLVHGEFERSDMVEYFGEQLDGYAFSELGWVQSYGSRCVKPPILFGDISRPKAMTVEWISYAQSLTTKPMKGMLTGPVTILNWSFVRDDQPRSASCLQLALAIRDEVLDLEKAGVRIIQIDEAALREGLPLRRSQWQPYLDWAVESFRIAANGVADETQIHTHMCYSEFNDIIQSIADMDADVITIETARSDMELLDVFEHFAYPNEIGPGVYDIHSPNIPTQEHIVQLMRKAAERIPPQRLWVNPDCGLKTRQWSEVLPALANMVAAARTLRATH